MVLYKIKKYSRKSVSIRTCDAVRATYLYLPSVYRLRHMAGAGGALESRTHAVKLPEDFRSSFFPHRCVCKHGDVGAFR